MNEQQIYDTVADVLVEELEIDRARISPTANIFSGLGVDSLELMAAVVALEEKFGVALEDIELENVQTVHDVVALVTQKMAKQ